MIEFEVGGKKYQAGRLSVFDQMAVAKRLMPAIKNLVTPEFINATRSKLESENGGEAKIGVSAIVPAIADAIYSLKDEDAERIVRTSLKVVSRQNSGGAFSPLLASSGDLLFDDVSLPNMLQIAWKVIESHLGDFFFIAP